MGSVNKIVKRSPGFIKRLYYNSVPFSKRYGKVYENTLSFLMESSKWDIETKKEYQLTRAEEYPEMWDQLDALFHDIDEGKLDKTGSFYALLKEVKDTYPKA